MAKPNYSFEKRQRELAKKKKKEEKEKEKAVRKTSGATDVDPSSELAPEPEGTPSGATPASGSPA